MRGTAIAVAVSAALGLGADPYKALQGWERESWMLAKTVAYQDGALAIGTTKAQAPVLPKGYWNRARDLADLRVATAGHRLADVLALVR
jgi:hypothetical protein